MARLTYEELNAIKAKLGVDTLWSWSRYHTYHTDPYSYLLRYIKHIKPDRTDGRYGASGSSAHEILEKLYLGKIQYEDMPDEWDTQVMLLDMSGLKYNRSDEEKNNKIASKYEYCVKHFFQNHVMVKSKPLVEEFVVMKVGNYYFNGYIDFMHEEVVTDEDGNEKRMLYITDFKTSTIYTGQKAIDESGQLTLYAEAMRQKLGIPLENIVIRWNFLKYVTVGEPTVKGEIKYRNIERHQIGEKLSSKAKLHLKRAGYTEEEISNFILQMIDENSIDCLPEEIKSKYTFDDCYVNIELNEDTINELKNEIIETLDTIGRLTEEYKETEDDMLFYQEVNKQDEYYYFNLCDYSRSIHKPWNDYLNDMNMFSNDKDTGNVANIIADNQTEEDDLTWLDDLLNDRD